MVQTEYQISKCHDFFCPLRLLLHRNGKPCADALLMVYTDSCVWATLLKHLAVHNVNHMLRPTKYIFKCVSIGKIISEQFQVACFNIGFFLMFK